MLFFLGKPHQGSNVLLSPFSLFTGFNYSLYFFPTFFPYGLSVSICLHVFFYSQVQWSIMSTTLWLLASSPWPCGVLSNQQPVPNPVPQKLLNIQKLCEPVKSLVPWNWPLLENSYMEIGKSYQSGISLLLISLILPRCGLLGHHCPGPSALPLPQLWVKITVCFSHAYMWAAEYFKRNSQALQIFATMNSLSPTIILCFPGNSSVLYHIYLKAFPCSLNFWLYIPFIL